jgi:replicative DNA helicase
MNLAEAFTQLHSHEAEQSVLGALMLDNTGFDRVGDLLQPGDFYEPTHRTIFSAIATLINACKPADPLTVLDAGASDLPYLTALVHSVPSARNIRHYATIVRDRSIERELVRLSGEAYEVARGDQPPAEKLDAIQALFAALQGTGTKSMPKTTRELLAPTLDRLNDLSEGKKTLGVSCGIGSIDRVLNGGLRPGGLYILAARPSIGKSSLAQAISINVAKGGSGALFLSQEMPSAELMDRALANVGHVLYEQILQGRLEPDDWTRVADAADELMHLPLHIDDQPALKLSDIRAKANAVKRQGLSVIVVDYLQLCTATRKDGNRTAEVGEISRGLKAIAKELGVSVIALSQLNRAVEDRVTPEPTLRDLRDSGEIEQDADVVMFLWPCREQVMGLTFAKNRQGKRGVRLALEFQGAYQRWYESTASVEPPTRTEKRKGGFE